MGASAVDEYGCSHIGVFMKVRGVSVSDLVEGIVTTSLRIDATT